MNFQIPDKMFACMKVSHFCQIFLFSFEQPSCVLADDIQHEPENEMKNDEKLFRRLIL